MKNKQKFPEFCQDEKGAVTADWVMLAAFLVVVGAVVAGMVNSGSEKLGENIQNFLEDDARLSG